MTPSDQTSQRPSTSRAERSCSGDMYIGEPTTLVVRVTAEPRGSTNAALAALTFEIPKSMTLTIREPSARSARKRFSGLMSRWTMPAACASAIASQASRTKETASSAGKAPFASMMSARSRPESRSRTRYGVPSGSDSTSITRATCSLSICATARPSRSKRARVSSSAAASGKRNLSATGCWSFTWMAPRTMPIPPAPRIDSTRYFPSITSPNDAGRRELVPRLGTSFIVSRGPATKRSRPKIQMMSEALPLGC